MFGYNNNSGDRRIIAQRSEDRKSLGSVESPAGLKIRISNVIQSQEPYHENLEVPVDEHGLAELTEESGSAQDRHENKLDEEQVQEQNNTDGTGDDEDVKAQVEKFTKQGVDDLHEMLLEKEKTIEA